MLEQIINYRVPTDGYDELARYDGSVIVERTRGTMAARCDKEGLNLLALNLANDVATKKPTPEEARAFYAKTAKAFKQGKRPLYTRRLLFRSPARGTGDGDRMFRG